MIRQAGRVRRWCAAYARPARWPVQVPPIAPLLRPQHSRALGTSSVGDTTVEPNKLGGRASHAPTSRPVQQDTRDGPDFQPPARPSLPQPSPRDGGPQAARDAEDDAPSDSACRTGRWVLPKSRGRKVMPYLAYRTRRAGKTEFRKMRKRFRAWESHFRGLWRRLEGLKTDHIYPWKDADMEQLQLLLQLNSVQEMRSWWFAKPKPERERDWQHTVLATMNFYPERTAQVLEATAEAEATLPYAVQDVLCFLVRWSSRLPPGRRAEQQAALPGLLLHLLRLNPPHYFCFLQWVLGQIIAVSEPETAAEIFSALLEHKHPLHPNTKLQIAGRLAKLGTHKMVAVGLLEEVVKEGEVDVNDRRCAALASSLFRLPQTWEDGRGSVVELQSLGQVYERLTGLGLCPNIVTYTAMIRALCLSDQLDTAWRIYDIMREQGTTPDPHVYSILLNGAKLSGSLESTIRVIEEAPASALRLPLFWNDIIHTLLVAAIREDRARRRTAILPTVLPVFDSMLQVYAKFFKLRPLQRLIPLDLYNRVAAPAVTDHVSWEWKEKLALVLDRLPVSHWENLVEPEADTLGIMLIGCLRGFDKAYPIMAFYSRFRSMLKNHDPIAVSLVRYSTLPYDCVIKAVSGIPGMLRVAVDIINDMLKDAADSAHSLRIASQEKPDPEPIPGAETAVTREHNKAPNRREEEAASTITPTSTTTQPGKKFTDTSFYHPPPSTHTWTILLHAFLRRHHVRRGSHILRIMRQHGTKPNRVSWNIVVGAFARMQDTKSAMDALEKLEEHGYTPDVHTIAAVSRLVNPEQALAGMESRVDQHEAEMKRRMDEAAAVLMDSSEWARGQKKRLRKQGSLTRNRKARKKQVKVRKKELKARNKELKARKKEMKARKKEMKEKAKERREKAKKREEKAKKREEKAKERREKAMIATQTVTAAARAAKDAGLPDEFVKMYDDLIFMKMRDDLTELRDEMSREESDLGRLVRGQQEKPAKEPAKGKSHGPTGGSGPEHPGVPPS